MRFHLNNLLFWAACPFLVPQALYLRQTAPRFAPAGGPQLGSVGNGESRTLLAIGDSIIAGVGATDLSRALVGQTASALAATTQQKIDWSALGVSGHTSAKILDELVPRLPARRADYFVVSAGVNDVTGLSSIAAWRRNLGDILDALNGHSPQASIALAGMPPLHLFPLLPQPLRSVFGMRARSFEAVALQLAAQRPFVVHVPVEFDAQPQRFAADGYHPSELGYQEFGGEVAASLARHQAGRCPRDG